MHTAGLVLDLYDNPRDFKSIFPSLDVVPDMVKTAEWLTPTMLEALPDDAFALVMLGESNQAPLRKYACIDAGNVAMSMATFFLNGHKLPAEAQKVAALNLVKAAGWYGIEVPEELEKVALGVGTVMTALTAPSLLKGTAGQMSGNLAATRAAGGQVLTPRDQSSLGGYMKRADVSGTSLMPNQDAGDLSDSGARGKPGSSNTSAIKSAEVGHLVDHHRGEVPGELETTRGAAGEQYERAPQAPALSLKPHIGVLNKEPPKMLKQKEASNYAYGNAYPLDSYAQVQAAVQYFDSNFGAMEPEMRHTFAVNMVKRASAMGIPFSKTAADYGSTTFAPDEHIRIALDTRRPFLKEAQVAVLDTLYERRAELGPDQFCDVLSEFDKVAEIDYRYDSAVVDPAASTFGVQKTAADEGDSWISGNDYVTKRQIENYSVTAGITLADDYGADFKKEFMKDPWGIFNSLPLEQKRRMARAASDNGATGLHDVQ